MVLGNKYFDNRDSGNFKLLCFVDVPLREEPCVQKQQVSWVPTFFYKLDKEVHYFAGQDIIIKEAWDSFAATTWPAVRNASYYKFMNVSDVN